MKKEEQLKKIEIEWRRNIANQKQTEAQKKAFRKMMRDSFVPRSNP